VPGLGLVGEGAAPVDPDFACRHRQLPPLR
jgi:hypothetical protein